jgi:hypothetical protein
MWEFWIFNFEFLIADCRPAFNQKSAIENRKWRYAGYCDFPGALLIT